MSTKTILEYIWIDGYLGLRSKTRVSKDKITNISDLPEWNFDGSSTNQANSDGDTEIILKPVKYVKDPFKRYENYETYLVLCDTYDNNGNPALNNNRFNATKIFNQKLEEEPWFGLEQEYFFVDEINKIWPIIYKQGDWYCGLGKKQPIERYIADEHLEYCLYSGLDMSGVNSEVAPYQWEFQVGPSTGIDAGDQLWLSRYILGRIAEKCGVTINYHPKPMVEINGSGCHTNFSTSSTRVKVENNNDSCVEKLHEYIEKMSKVQKEHIDVYGTNNEARLTGHHETGNINVFSYGIGTRNTSIRIPNQVYKNREGLYLEDRRPASNMDPYLVTSQIFKTCCL
jgi:glutamine synthetase